MRGSELRLEPLTKHRKYDEVDETLKSIFAEAVIRKAVAEGLPLTSLVKALREGTVRKALRFTFSQLEKFGAAELEAVSEGLPATLESLDAAFESCSQLADVAPLGAGLEKLQALTSLNLNFGFCEQLADVAALGAGLEKLQALTSLDLNFESCSELSNTLRKRFSRKADFVEALGA